MKYRLHFIAISISLLCILLDQILKKSIFPQVNNTGGVLGLAIDGRLVIFGHIAVVALGLIFLQKIKGKILRYIVLAVLIVSLSNLADRIFAGGVIDYVNLAGVWFNLTDVVVDCGIIIIIIRLLWFTGWSLKLQKVAQGKD